MASLQLQRSRKASTTSTSTSSSEIVFKSPPASTSKLPSTSSHGRGDSTTSGSNVTEQFRCVPARPRRFLLSRSGPRLSPPAVLSLPALGKQHRRVARDAGRESFGSVMTGSGHGSHPGSPHRGLKRLSSFKSGWVVWKVSSVNPLCTTLWTMTVWDYCGPCVFECLFHLDLHQ
ncbi:hypothetical protein FA13DRAFT_999023 [Coprinellus micaceus]|uniref:Uncharacterized protein n=1 Tax=Coprinellus micaceus TaxID=71717 RepID=A0A4Y7RQJ3_COPMI|nr:hypothetical protein FA13DRAFT_999023 [Coprinellus micaceus]